VEARKLLEAEVGEVQLGPPGQALQELLEVPLVGQGQGAREAAHLHPRLLGGLLPHRHDQTLRLHLGL